MILEHDPQLAREILSVARGTRRFSGRTYVRWLRLVRELGREAGLELAVKDGHPATYKYPPMVVLGVAVPPWLKEELILLADDLGITLSELVRQALVDFLLDLGVIDL